MTDIPDWLSALVLFQSYGGDWNDYVDALYEFYEEDFINSAPTFKEKRVGVKRHPRTYGKDWSFWHLIQEGKIEENREPDLRRCERIRWPRPVIENSDTEKIKVWPNRRGRAKRICLWLESQEYLVILDKRKGHFILWTAYCVTKKHRKRKLQKEYEEYQKRAMPPQEDGIATPSTAW